MHSQIRSLEMFKAVNPSDLPEGEYMGTWGGYVVEFIVEGKFYRADVVKGIRTPAVPCLVKVKGNKITVDTDLRKDQGGENARQYDK